MQSDKSILEKYRKEIDGIDDEILSLLLRRLDIVRKVGALKARRNNGRSIISPGREAMMVRRLIAGLGDKVSRAAVAQVWRIIIASAVNIEEATNISVLATHGDRECFWLSREYFGSFTPMTQHPTMIEVVQDVVDEKASVGVVPVTDNTSPHPWWARVVSEENRPRVFATIPFIRISPSKKVPFVALGFVDPEETGDDESLWVIRCGQTTLFEALLPRFKKAKLEATLLESCRVFDAETLRYYLIKIEGFVSEEDERMKNLLELANSDVYKGGEPVSAHYLGSYATPITFE